MRYHPEDNYEPRYEAGYAEGYKAAKAEMRETIDTLVAVLKKVHSHLEYGDVTNEEESYRLFMDVDCALLTAKDTNK